ncbi:MAG: addiction module protein [Pirellulales bacterium]|nr:addiction module protein [Pirellulales bacterium]
MESALSLPQSQRADMARQLLQSLDQPGEEISAEEFSQQIHDRVEKYRSGDIGSCSLDEAREIIEKKIAEGPNN